ncbi:MAG: ribosomal protein S18 acetylase RimI-like enzyme [Colwellia sp.]|jgi:ribosomal protein S18 acetylase RimI-like enzyme
METDFKLICDGNAFESIKDSWVKLLSITLKDDSILGFDEEFFSNSDLVNQYTEKIKAEINVGALILLVAEYQDELIVCCNLKLNHQQTTQHICDLQKGLIHPKYRRKGLLEKSLAHIASFCIERKIELLTLDVRANSIGHKVWVKSGFQTYGELDDYCRFNGMSYSGCFMKQKTQHLLDKFYTHIQ